MTEVKKVTKKVASKTQPAPPAEPVMVMPAIYGSMVEVMQGLEAIGKDRENKQQGFKFRGVDQAYNALHPLMAKAKIFMVPRVLDMRARVDRTTRNGGNITFTLLDVEFDFISGIDGSLVTAGPVIGEGADSGDKGCNKALAVAHKYILFQTFLIPTEKTDDPDLEAHDIAPVIEAQPAPVKNPPPPPQPAATDNKSGNIEISDPAEAVTVASLMINLAEGMKTVDALKDFWVTNYDRVEYMKAHYPIEFARINGAIKAHKIKLTEQDANE